MDFPVILEPVDCDSFPLQLKTENKQIQLNFSYWEPDFTKGSGTVGLPDPLRLTVHSLYPAAAAITAGIYLVGRPRPAIIISLCCSTERASCVVPVGNKVQRIVLSRSCLSSRLHRVLDVIGSPEVPNNIESSTEVHHDRVIPSTMTP